MRRSTKAGLTGAAAVAITLLIYLVMIAAVVGICAWVVVWVLQRTGVI